MSCSALERAQDFSVHTPETGNEKERPNLFLGFCRRPFEMIYFGTLRHFWRLFVSFCLIKSGEK